MRKIFIILFLSLAPVIIGQELKILVTFSEQMNRTDLLNKNNFTVYNSEFSQVNIIKVGMYATTDSLCIVFVEPLSYKTNFIIRVQNVRDKSGNLINTEYNSAWFYFDGFSLNEIKPKIKVKNE